MNNLPLGEKVCVIVPIRSFHSRVDKCIDSLFNLDYPDFEVIIIGDGLSEENRDILNKYINKRQAKILDSPGRGPSYARNLGAKNNDAEFIAFTDADCIVDNNWLRELLLGFQEFPQAVACGGIQRLPQDATDFQKKVFFFMKRVGFITEYMRKAKQKKIKEVNHNASCNVIYRKDAFLSEGGFLEGLWPGEDVELDYRLSKRGYKLVFNPQAIVYHYRPRDLKSFLKMMYRYGLAQGFLVKKYGIFRKIQLVPLFVLTVILITSICLLWNWQIGLLGIVVLIILLYLYFALNLRILGLGITGILIWNIGFLKKILSFK